MSQPTLHWFRKGLRLHDNPALLEAARSSSALYPVFFLDPWFADPAKICTNRYSFLLQSLADLDASLRAAHGSRLLVVRGSPVEELPRLAQAWGVRRVTFERDTEPYALRRDAALTTTLQGLGIEVKAVSGHTLWDMDAIVAKAGGAEKVPSAYQSFLKITAALGPPAKPLPVPGSGGAPPLPPLGPLGASSSSSSSGGGSAAGSDDAYAVPSLAAMGFDPSQATTPFRGGESLALKRMAENLARVEWIGRFSKPDTAPTGLTPDTTVLSPYLKFGCLSPRTFYWGLQDAYAEYRRRHGSAAGLTAPPVSLEGQLLWREFFYANAYAVPNFDRMEGNRLCRQIPWEFDAAKLRAWEEGRTGYPWIDACMAQLRVEGWLHHLARHAVACFLTRGDLYHSWEHGAKVFDRLLLDSDWALNNGNWMWLSASAFFYQFHRVYSPVAFPKKTDPSGAFVRKWVPALARLPDAYIYEPWKAPRETLRAAGVELGVTYPHRIVDHDAVLKPNLGKHSAAYKAHSEGGAKAYKDAAAAAAAGSGVGATQVGSDPRAAAAVVEALGGVFAAAGFSEPAGRRGGGGGGAGSASSSSGGGSSSSSGGGGSVARVMGAMDRYLAKPAPAAAAASSGGNGGSASAAGAKRPRSVSSSSSSSSSSDSDGERSKPAAKAKAKRPRRAPSSSSSASSSSSSSDEVELVSEVPKGRR